jgi:isoaspartyl peptidase/L-asparaginase-like protein (Ntn-hydrolase superfamily)
MNVLVHGGAGGSPDDPDSRQAVLDDAAATGADESDPLSAVESAVRVLESDPKFNAGRGSAVQSDGRVRTDAGVMRSDRSVGAACAMEGVEHAVSAARVVLEETPHVFVTAPQATVLAEDYGVATDRDLWTERTRERWAEAGSPAGSTPRAHLRWVHDRFGGAEDDPTDHDTVGAVARDGERYAAATSTGGRWYALAGRVGDVPQVGAGFYCNEAGAASATGAGEAIASTSLSRRAVGYMEAGHGASTAARFALNEFEKHSPPDASAGIILVGADDTGSAYNSDAMQTALARQ